MHPFALPARTHNTSIPQVSEVPGYLRLTLLQNFHEIADTDLSTIHEIEQPQARWVGESGKQTSEIQ